MKKGYTLIELLAVIALLAILLLLMVPRVIDIYVEAKKNTFKNEALSIVTSAETKYIAESIINDNPLECWEYKDDNNELKGYVEYKEGYSGKVVKAGDTIYINVTNGEYTIKGLTKRNAGERDTSSIIEGTEKEYSRDFTCSEEGALETEIKLESKTYNKMFVYINVPELEVIGKEDKERENITYQFSIDEGEWTEEQTSMYYFYKELEPETEYEIKGRVLVKNEVVGTSDILIVTTDKILGPTITLSPPTKTYNSVMLTAESEHTQPDLITEKYEFSKDAGITWEPIQTSNTYTFTGLTPNTEYTFKVRGTNNKGVTGESEGIKVTTEAITPPVITLTSPTKTYNSVSLVATASDNQTGIKSGTYQFSKDNGVTWSALQSTNTYTFTGLISGTSYNFKARVQNNGGLVGDSSTLSITTTVAPLLKDSLLANNTVKSGAPDFTKEVTIATTGIYQAEDDYGTSYYFRGDKSTLKNNVIFGGYQWKVIRITGAGEIKLIYNGTCPNNSCSINSTGTATQYTTSAFNPSYYLFSSIGYMYGSPCWYTSPAGEDCYKNVTNSIIKGVLETFYSGLRQSAKNLVSDTIYCNDRHATYDFAYGGFYLAYYNAWLRLYGGEYGGMPRAPILKCFMKSDAFTVSDTTRGNGASTYPIGLITVDEAFMGGAGIGQSLSHYLFTGQNYWTISPFAFDGLYVDGGGIATGAYPAAVSGMYGSVDRQLAGYSLGVRPVIALKSDVAISGGNGSAGSPFQVIE